MPHLLFEASEVLAEVVNAVTRNARSPKDRSRVAELTGEARHHAKWRPLTADEEPPR